MLKFIGKLLLLFIITSSSQNSYSQETSNTVEVKEMLDHCNNYPKTKEFKHLKKITIAGYDAYYDKNTEEIKYIDNREQMKNFAKNPSTDSNLQLLAYLHYKIHNMKELLSADPQNFCLDSSMGCNDYTKDHAIDRNICDCQPGRFQILFSSCAIDHAEFDK